MDVGWRVLKVSGQDCSEKSSAEIQARVWEKGCVMIMFCVGNIYIYSVYIYIYHDITII